MKLKDVSRDMLMVVGAIALGFAADAAEVTAGGNGQADGDSLLRLVPAPIRTFDKTLATVSGHIGRLRKEKGLLASNGLKNENPGGSADMMVGSPSNSYFLVVVGGANPSMNNLCFWADAAMYYSTLRIKYEVPKENIELLVSDGGDPGKDALACVSDGGTNYWDCVSSPADMDGDGVPDVTGRANYETLEKTLKTFEEKLTTNDQLTVFIASHGSPIGEASSTNRKCAVWLFDEDPSKQEVVRDWQLASLTENIKCPVGFVIEACNSGGFIDDITNTPQRVIATACRHDEYAYGGEGLIPGESLETFDGAVGSYSYWALWFNCAMRCRIPLSAEQQGAYPWEDDDEDLTPDVDTNGDGRISFGEAFAYACNNDPYAAAQYEHPQFGESEAGLAERFFTLKMLPKPGTKGNPWKIGATEADSVVAWTDGTGNLVVEGTGVVTNLPAAFDRSSITSAEVGDGITEVCAWFFKDCTNVKSVMFGRDVVTFGEEAFSQCRLLETITIANELALDSLKDAVNYRLTYGAEGKFVMVPKINVEGYVEMLYGRETLTGGDWEPIGKLSDQNMEAQKSEGRYHFFQTRLVK